MNAQRMLVDLARTLTTLHTLRLDHNIRFLKHNRYADPVQRAQSEAIVELHGIVKEIHDGLLSMIPGADAALAEAEAAQRAPRSSRGSGH